MSDTISVNGQDVTLVHVRHDGQSHDVYVGDLNIEGETDSGELFQALEDNLDLAQGALSGFELDIVPTTKTAVARPQAKFGR